jgi:hypothetical protein
MDRETVIKLAREAGFDCAPDGHIYADDTDGVCDNELERFAKLLTDHNDKLWFKRINEAVASEREACAKVCEAHKIDGQLVHSNAVVGCATAIRARGGDNA